MTQCGTAVALDNAMFGATKGDFLISRALRSEIQYKAGGLPLKEENFYCYRTIGNINCARTEDPYSSDAARRLICQAAFGD